MNDPELVDKLIEDIPELASVQEVAELLRVREVSISKWIRQGHLKALRAGKRVVRIPKDQLRDFLIAADNMEDINEKD